MFADYVATLYYTVRALQRQIDIIDQFCTSTNIILNLDKSKVVVFPNGGILNRLSHGTTKINKCRLYRSMNIWVFISLLQFPGQKH